MTDRNVQIDVRRGIAILRAGGDLDAASDAMLGRDEALTRLAGEAMTALKAFADEYHDARLEQALGLLAAVRNDYFTDEEVQS